MIMSIITSLNIFKGLFFVYFFVTFFSFQDLKVFMYKNEML